MESITEKKQIELADMATLIREDIVKMLVEAGSGHSAGSLGMADIFATLYFGDVLRHDPQNPLWEERDRLVLSNGHICPVLYATLARAGYLPLDELTTLRDFRSRLQGHPHRENLPGVETTSGPLGSGLSQASGMAYAARLDGAKWRVYCLLSDGEHDEGNTWEAVMFAAKYKLNNLTAIIDRNNIQIDGYTEDVMPLNSLATKYEAFNWHVIEIDGHDYGAIKDACDEASSVADRPTVIVARTIPGKDIEYMENLPEWHGKSPNVGEAIEALRELRTLQGKIEAEYD
ncbi:transketolase [candidate division WWE3 bacterium]|uniref:Transketolase n=1 Tax=candidate division WWE3 bacterium TaxID=2053526 RepID=A0A955RRK0_UNCKA|nr:transketolase [candidate division WWE3 bacterium]